jgi:hypothetical protein
MWLEMLTAAWVDLLSFQFGVENVFSPESFPQQIDL